MRRKLSRQNGTDGASSADHTETKPRFDLPVNHESSGTHKNTKKCLTRCDPVRYVLGFEPDTFEERRGGQKVVENLSERPSLR